MKGVSAIFGLHVWPWIPTGMLGSRAGPIMGACQQFEARLTGVGGHAAMPHATVDPIVAAASTVTALQVEPCPFRDQPSAKHQHHAYEALLYMKLQGAPMSTK